MKHVSKLVGNMPHVEIPANIRSHLPKMAPKTLLTRDYPEVLLLYGWLGFAASFGVYSLKKVLFENDAGSFINVNMRGDIDRQFGDKVGKDAEEYTAPSPANSKHSLWWRLAQVKTDENGANIGIIWDNRTRPHQYSKPGEAGIGAGATMAGL
jgi:hypothetical protein